MKQVVTKVKAYFAKPQEKTVDSILSAFNTQINELEAISVAQQEKAALQRSIAESAVVRAKAATDEAARAAKVMQKIQALIA